MKKRVDYSTFSWILTLIVTAALGIGLAVSKDEPAALYPLLIIVFGLYLPALFFAPIYISANENEIEIDSSFKIRSIPMSEVSSVERYRPLPSTIRTCASGGFLGYWGTFRDSVVGKYVGYWGNKNDCFLVILKSGKKYLLGCRDCDAMMDYIKSHIKK